MESKDNNVVTQDDPISLFATPEAVALCLEGIELKLLAQMIVENLFGKR